MSNETEPARAPKADETKSRLPLMIGLMAFVGGLYLLLESVGVNLPPFKDIWPFFLILAGLASFIDFLALSRRPRSAGGAVTFIGFGVLGFAVSLGWTSWGDFLDWLPSFPTIFGLGFLTTWAVGGRRDNSLMVAGMVLVTLGVLGYAARFDVLKRILPSAQVVWALVLLLGGGALMWKTFASKRQT